MIACGGDDTPTAPTPTPPIENRAPGLPTIDATRGAPADASVDQPVTSWAYWKCTDPDGDALKFDVFFGASANPPSVATDQTATGHNPGTLAFSTKYYWKIVAKDPDGETSTSAVWSFTTTAPVAETITTPDTPTGPAAGETGQSLDYDTGNAASNLGHTLEYRYDWGDGSLSGWSSSTTASSIWATADTYSVKAQARCATHTTVESAWSGATDVTITAAVETVSVPGDVNGSATAEVGHSQTYSVSTLSTTSLGHPVEYRYDWGDGNYSTWVSNQNSFHTWTAVGPYDIKAQARCRDHTTVESGWTPAFTVFVSEPTETIGTPGIVNPPTGGGVGEDKDFWSNYGTSSEGHPTEYRYDYGDGTISAWSASHAGTHAWTAAGTYEVKSQARCATHTTAESAWSDPASIDISDAEVITMGTITPTADIEVAKGVLQTLIVRATSSFGHSVDFYIDWGDGQFQDWWPSTQYSHAWDAVGGYDVRIKARCRDHTTVESEWSLKPVNVVESITRPVVTGPAFATKNTDVTFNTTGSVSSEGHALEYRLWTSIYYYQSWTQDPWTAIDELTHAFPYAQTWYVKVQARCIEHQTESLPSGYIPITINN